MLAGCFEPPVPQVVQMFLFVEKACDLSAHSVHPTLTLQGLLLGNSLVLRALSHQAYDLGQPCHGIVGCRMNSLDPRELLWIVQYEELQLLEGVRQFLDGP